MNFLISFLISVLKIELCEEVRHDVLSVMEAALASLQVVIKPFISSQLVNPFGKISE